MIFVSNNTQDIGIVAFPDTSQILNLFQNTIRDNIIGITFTNFLHFTKTHRAHKIFYGANTR